MNLNIIVWSVILLGFTALVLYLKQRNKKAKEKLLAPLHRFAKENNCVISRLDHWDNTLIGIDESTGNKLYFIRKTSEIEVRHAINISEIKNSRLEKITRTADFNREKVIVIDKIAVVISFTDTKKAEVSLEFYNSDYDNLSLTGELQLAEKWSEIVNDTSHALKISNKKTEKQNDQVLVNHTNLKGRSKVKVNSIPG